MAALREPALESGWPFTSEAAAFLAEQSRDSRTLNPGNGGADHADIARYGEDRVGTTIASDRR